VESVADAILSVIILILTILTTLLHIVWLLVLAVHRSVDGINGAQGPGMYVLIFPQGDLGWHPEIP